MLRRLLFRLSRATSPRPRRLRLSRGGAAVEFVITLPVIVLLLLGSVEYGNYFSQLGMVNSATRNGARYGGTRFTMADARVQAAVATRTLLSDLGFTCAVGSADCVVVASIIQQEQIDLVEVRVDITYDALTSALPASSFIPAIPSVLRARAVYPIVGN